MQVNEWGASSKEIVKRLPSYHAIILAENNVGESRTCTGSFQRPIWIIMQ